MVLGGPHVFFATSAVWLGVDAKLLEALFGQLSNVRSTTAQAHNPHYVGISSTTAYSWPDYSCRMSTTSRVNRNPITAP